MPQKKNPDAYELMRGKAGRLIGNLNALLVVLKGLPLGYSKDLQEDKESLFDSVDSILGVLAVLPEMLRTADFESACMREAAGGFALATELADFLAARGVPFREAHRVIGRLVRQCEEANVSLEDVPAEELVATHPALADLPRELLTPEGSVANKRSAGSTSLGSVQVQLRKAREFLEGR
jgi:argininosuccinate lyase